VKLRAGGSPADIAVIEAVRAALPGRVQIMVDANEKCDLVGARWLLDAARAHNVLFVEEPLPGTDVAGYRKLSKAGGAAIAAGEHLQGRAAFMPFVSEGLADLIQPDLAMAGGLTPLLDIATLAEAFGVSVSPHFLPGLFAHVAAVSPVVTWLEEFPLLEPIFEGWPEQVNGALTPGAEAGHGLVVEKSQRARCELYRNTE
jgi:L-alanine-DL-glutamate epimerase-like enolase superfamily enzyme